MMKKIPKEIMDKVLEVNALMASRVARSTHLRSRDWDREDMQQEALLTVIKRLTQDKAWERFLRSPGGDRNAYLNRATYHACLSYLRAKGTPGQRMDLILDAPRGDGGDDSPSDDIAALIDRDDPHRVLEARQAAEKIEAVLTLGREKMSPTERIVFDHATGDGDIPERCSGSLKTCRTRGQAKLISAARRLGGVDEWLLSPTPYIRLYSS